MWRHTLFALLALASWPRGPLGADVAQPGTAIFRFETDGFWLNLHHFLYVLGRADAGMPDIKRRAVANAPADQDEGLK